MTNETTSFYDRFWARAQYKVGMLATYNKDESFVFGTKDTWEGDDYKILPAMSLSEITKIEKDKTITLPDEFKSYLLNYGVGGAGPDYGIVDLKEAFIDAVFDQPFIYHEHYAEDGIEDFSGLLYIATAGCGTDYYIELKGETVGTIWCNWGSTGSSKEGNICDYYASWLNASYASIISRQRQQIQELQDQTVINNTFYTVEEYDKARSEILDKPNGTLFQCSNCNYPVEYDRLTIASFLSVTILPILTGFAGSTIFDIAWYYLAGGVAIIAILTLALLKDEFTSKPSNCLACKTALLKPLKKLT